MFSNLLKNDYFNYLIDDSNNNYIKKDRLNYTPILNRVKKFIQEEEEKNTIISDSNKLIYNYCECNDKEYKYDSLDTSITLLSLEPKLLCTKLTNLIHSEFGKFTQMKSIITGYEYSIMYNMRHLVNIFKIEKYKNVNINNIIDPILINDLYYLPINIEIIDSYHKLFSLHFYSEWNDIKKKEKLMYNYFMDCYRKKTKASKLKKGGNCISCKKNRNTNVNNLKYILLELFDNENYVFINEWALYLYDNKKINIEKNNDDLVSIISSNNIKEDYIKIVNFLSKFTKYGIFYKEKKLYIPNNRRLKVYIFYIKYPDIINKKDNSTIDKPFLEIYNNASYELIPFIPVTYNYDNNIINLKIGNYYVLLYFIFIKIWLIDLLYGIECLSDEQKNIKYEHYYNIIKLINKNNVLFNITNNFIGIYYDEKIEKKMDILKSNISKKNYYPELAIKKDKKYKLVATS